MVKLYEDNHNHLPTGRARMLQQGAIARLFKEETRRRPEIRSFDIKDELMHRYNISVSMQKSEKNCIRYGVRYSETAVCKAVGL